MSSIMTLTTLIPSTPYILAYSLPLLFISLLLTFAGAFLTLDRTRSFPPSYDSLSGLPKAKFRWSLEGGIGGLAVGYAFGVHLATFLSLLIPAVTTLTSLNSKSFIAVWLFSSIVTTFLGGRWKYAALTFAGISGGALFALSISVIIHPALLTRMVFPAICIPIVLLFTLLPLPRTQHSALRFATSTTGAFGVVLSIALLAKIPAWANVWSRLWISDSLEWGTVQEKGLSTGFCLFLCLGSACDWVLKRQFGECPDQKWDHYLSSYTANLPSSADRAGTFRPLTSAWDRLFSSNKDVPLVFPTDAEMKRPIPTGRLSKRSSQTTSFGGSTVFEDSIPQSKFEYQSSPGFLKKARSQARFQAKTRTSIGGRRTREAVKFRPGEPTFDDSDEDEDDDVVKPLSPSFSDDRSSKVRPWLRQKASMASSTATLIEEEELDYAKEKYKVHKAVKYDGEALEYSDYEEDIAGSNAKKTSPEWSPGFLKKHPSSTHSQTTVVAVDPARAVPATPSLIKALDRIAVAQKDAFGEHDTLSHLPTPPLDSSGPRPGLPSRVSSGEGGVGLPTAHRPRKHHKPARWDDFWKDVVAKAQP